MMIGKTCSQCGVRTTAPCAGLSLETAKDFGQIVHRRRIPAGGTVYADSDKARSFAILVSGVVKLSNVRPDGRSQIVGLYFPSDFIGRPFESGNGLVAEAATDVEVCCFSGNAFENLMKVHPDLEHVILKRTIQDLDSARAWMFMIARKTAEERVASLLLLIARKMQRDDCTQKPCQPPGEIELPLSRTEIAESLGLRLETVSRQFAQLKADHVIATGRRRGLIISNMTELVRRGETGPE